MAVQHAENGVVRGHSTSWAMPSFDRARTTSYSTLVETVCLFCDPGRISKTRVPGLSCGVVCVILRLAVLVEHRLVTDRQTDKHRAMASTADA